MKKKEIPSRKTLEKDAKKLTYKELSDKYSVSPATIGRWLKKYNLHRIKANDAKNREDCACNALKVEAQNEGVVESCLKEAGSGCGKKDADVSGEVENFKNTMKSIISREYIMAGIQALATDAPGPGCEEIEEIVRKKIEDVSGEIVSDDFSSYYMSMGRWYMLFHNADKKEVIEAIKTAAAHLLHDHDIDIVFNVQNGANYSGSAALFNDVEGMLDYLSRSGGKGYSAAWQNVMGSRTAGISGISGNTVAGAGNCIKGEEKPLSAGIRIPDDVATAMKKCYTAIKECGSCDNEKELDSVKKPDGPDDTQTEIAAEAAGGMSVSEDTRCGDGDTSMEDKNISNNAIGIKDLVKTVDDNNGISEEDMVSEVFLVDSENVSASWKHFIKGDPGRRIRVLYTDTTPKMSYSDINEILKHPEGISMEQVYPGEKGGSGLDFQLVTILGFLLCEHPDRHYYIVSRDKGYEPVVRYWRDRGYSVEQLAAVNRELPVGEKAFSMLSSEEKKKMSDDCTNAVVKEFRTVHAVKEPVPEKDDAGKMLDRRIFLQKTIPGRKRNIYDKIMNILDSHNMTDFDHIHADFVDIFGGSQGERMYTLIKKKIKEYYSI